MSISELISPAVPELNAKVEATNKALRKLCTRNSYGYIAHCQIGVNGVKELNRGGIHLSPKGNTTLTSSKLYKLL